MTQTELNEILERHKKWLNGEEGGERADLSGCDLSGVNLSYAIMRGVILNGAIMHNVIMRCADMKGVDLSGSIMRDIDADYSLPLWCSSTSIHLDDKQLKHITYYLVKAGLQSECASEEAKRELSKLIDFANGFHRVDDCGKIEGCKE